MKACTEFPQSASVKSALKLRRQGPAAMSRLFSTFAIILGIAIKVFVSASPVTLFGDEHYGESDDGVSNDDTSEDSDDEEDDSRKCCHD